MVSGLVLVLAFVGFDRLGEAWGLPTSLRDEPSLWAMSRQRVEQSPEPQVVLVGASRSAFGTDLGVLERALPGIEANQLAIRGANPAPVLADLARRPPARGWVIVSLAGPSLEPQTRARAESYVQNYRVQWKPALAWERSIDTWVQERSRATSAVDELTCRVREALLGRPQAIDSDTTTADRQVLDSAEQLREHLAGPKGANRRAVYEEARRLHGLSPGQWRAALEPMLLDVERLAAHGIAVAFVRYPSSDPHRAIERAYYPRSLYWDELAAACARRGCTTLHFEDAPRLRDFVAEDGSHIPQETRGAFTTALVESLQEAGFLPRTL